MQQNQPLPTNPTSSFGLPSQNRHKIEELEFPFCPEASKYEKLAKIGQGTFGYCNFFY